MLDARSRDERQEDMRVAGIELDHIDLKILRELQNDGRMTNVDLAERVGISAPPCLRRVRKLEEAGIIEGYHPRMPWFPWLYLQTKG